MAAFDLGNNIHCTGQFNDNTTGIEVAVDPTAVYFQFRPPGSSSPTTYQYGVDGQLLKDATGLYRVVLDANLPGTWRFRFYSTGTGKASEDGEFTINESLTA